MALTLFGKQVEIRLQTAFFLISGIAALFLGQVIVGLIFLVIAFLLESSDRAKSRWFRHFAGIATKDFKYRLVWILWILLGFATLTLRLDNFGLFSVRPEWFGQPNGFLVPLFLVGLIASAFADGGTEKNQKDISVGYARIWFWVLFASAIFMRVYQVSSPEGSYGSDESVGIVLTRQIRDMQNYRQGYFINYLQPPIFTYLTLFFWHWIPAATDLFIARSTAIFCDMGTVWLLYLAGKELGGRRTGLLAMALGVISRPLLCLAVMSTTVVMVPFSLLLPLLFALRLFKRPDLKHFLQLGLAMSFGVYTNDYTRIQTLFFIGVLFLWVLSKKENRVWVGPMSWVLLGNGAAMLAYGFYVAMGFNMGLAFNRFFFENPTEGFLILLAAVVVLVGTRIYLGEKSPAVKKNRDWINVTLGVWVCLIVDYPIIAGCWSHLSEMIERHASLMDSLAFYGHKLVGSIQVLFEQGGWPANMGIQGDSLFSFGEVLVVFLGLAYALVKPRWSKIFVLMVASVGLLPHVLLGAMHNARLVDSVGPFLLLGALALNELMSKVKEVSRRAWLPSALWVLLIAVWGFSAWTTYDRVYHLWFDQSIYFNTGVRNLALEQIAQGRKVYYWDNVINGETMITSEDLNIQRLALQNTIYLAPGEKASGVALICHDFNFAPDKALLAQMKKYFPQAKWERRFEVVYCVIPAEQVQDARQKMFLVQPVPTRAWKREYSLTDCGILFGIVQYQDYAPRFDSPFLLFDGKRNDGLVREFREAARYTATIHVAKDGDYLVRHKSENRCWIKIDGKMIKDLTFLRFNGADGLPVYWDKPKEGDTAVHLTEGDHRVEVVVSKDRSALDPEFWIRPAGAPAPGTSLWGSFDF